MIGNRRCIGGLVVLAAHRLIVDFILEQRFAEFVANPDHLTDGALQLQLAFNEGSAQLVQAWMGEL
ncbi:hypothetical protein D3C76_1436120 [compost metagenome]